ncbi:MAG: ceramidase domain-containing protein [Acidobacteria bacterium]|nr:ceramidase domain-containing protein [Acidobacteriota bacterium]
MSKRTTRLLFLLLLALGASAIVLLLAPVAQPKGYHAFADQRSANGVPNFWNVASNLPFLFIGAYGVWVLLAKSTPGAVRSLRNCYLAVFAGTFLTGLGSGYYHIAPNDSTLAWDRLPMAITFMALFAVIIGEHIDAAWGASLLPVLLLVGVASVAYWRVSAHMGHEDLRPYIIVQYLPLLLVPFIITLFSSIRQPVGYIWGVLAAYAVAKGLELFDHAVYRLFGVVSGHTLKHVVAACGLLLLAIAVRRRHTGAGPEGA